MENALLIVHLVLVIFLVVIVLLQRSEGGALGMGGGGGGGGVMTGRGAATALQRATWYIAGGFIATSLTLTILANTERRSESVFDTDIPGIAAPTEEGGASTFVPPTIDGTSDDGAELVPSIGGDAAPASSGDPDNLVPVAPQ